MANICAKVLGREVVAQTKDMAKVLDVHPPSPRCHQTQRSHTNPAHSLQRFRSLGWSEDKCAQYQIMNDHYDECGFRGNPNILRFLLGREPTSFEDFVRRLAKTQAAL